MELSYLPREMRVTLIQRPCSLTGPSLGICPSPEYPLLISCVKLQVVGTRVLCFRKILKKGAQRDCMIIAFDIWNPAAWKTAGTVWKLQENCIKSGETALKRYKKVQLVSTMDLVILIIHV